MPATRGKKKSDYEKQLEKTKKAVQKVKDTKAALDKAVKKRKAKKRPPMPVALPKPKDKVRKSKAYDNQLEKTKKAVQKVKDTKYKLQLEKTAKAVQKVKDTKYKAQLEKTAKAVQKVKDTKAALKPKNAAKKAVPKRKKFSDDVSDVKTKAPTIKKGTKITPTFKEIKEKPKKAKAPAKPKKIKFNVIQKEVAKRKPAVKKKAQKAKVIAPKKRVASIPKVNKAREPEPDPEASDDERSLGGKASAAEVAKRKGKAKAKAEPKGNEGRFLEKGSAKYYKDNVARITAEMTARAKPEKRKFVEKATTSKVLSGIKSKPDVMGGLFNAAHITLGNLIEKQFKDMNAEIRKYRTAKESYFERVHSGSGGAVQYHTKGADALLVHQKLIETQFEKAIALAPSGIANPIIQQYIKSYNRRGKSGMKRAREGKLAAEQRLGIASE